MDVAISLPNERHYVDVARLVCGGAASRLDFGFEAVDDLQLAIESVLAAGLSREAEIGIELAVRDGSLRIWVGPLDEDSLEAGLRGADRAIALDRLLGRLVDEARPEGRDGRSGLLLVKRLPACRAR